MNNFHINKITQERLKDMNILRPSDVVIVACPGQENTSILSSRRYLWNVHSHGQIRCLDPGRDYLLVGLTNRPTDETDIEVLHVFRIPGNPKTKTLVYREGTPNMEQFRVQTFVIGPASSSVSVSQSESSSA